MIFNPTTVLNGGGSSVFGYELRTYENINPSSSLDGNYSLQLGNDERVIAAWCLLLADGVVGIAGTGMYGVGEDYNPDMYFAMDQVHFMDSNILNLYEETLSWTSNDMELNPRQLVVLIEPVT